MMPFFERMGARTVCLIVLTALTAHGQEIRTSGGDVEAARDQLTRMNEVLADMIELAKRDGLTPRSLGGFATSLNGLLSSVSESLPWIGGTKFSFWLQHLSGIDDFLDTALEGGGAAGIDRYLELATGYGRLLLNELERQKSRALVPIIAKLKAMILALEGAAESRQEGIWDETEVQKAIRDVIAQKGEILDALPAFLGHGFRAWYTAFSALQKKLTSIEAEGETMAALGQPLQEMPAKLRQAKQLKEAIEAMLPPLNLDD